MKKAKPAKRVKAGTSKAAAAKRRKDFVEAYIRNGGNATQAAIKAGFSPKGADAVGARLSGDIKIAAEIKCRRAVEIKKSEEITGITIERTLRELGRLAYFDVGRLFDEKGEMIPIHKLPADVRASIAQIVQVEKFSGRGEERELVGYTKKVKIWDKNSALEKTMKNLGLFEADNKQRPDLTVNVGILTVPLEAMNFNQVRARALKAA